ncbi:MAG: TadE/TadG family type IV pilus assembly protein [Planctomycetota bacterium]|jgi:Flp pilus assembly protein TadG
MDVVRRRKESRHRGAAAAEAALVLPLLLLVTFGAIKYGWLFLKAQQITNAARNGARMAAMPDVLDPNVKASVINLLATTNIDANDNDIDINPVTVSGRLAVNVTVTIPSRKVDLLRIPLFPNVGDLSASITMAEEGN